MTRYRAESAQQVFSRKSAAAASVGVLLGLFSLLASSTVLALGLGDVKLSSALNQPLNASIEVYTNSAEEAKGLSARLASPAAFQRAGIDRPAYLEDMQISVGGSATDPAIALKTKRPFREPFVHFLLEVSWETGRLRREYTLLLDPPVTSSKQASRNSPTAKPATRTPTRTRQTASKPVSGDAAKGYEYGPVAKGTTLWGLASKLAKRSGVSVQQMMLGLLRNNPQAFYGNNVNSMKPGNVLKVPSRAESQSLSTDAAIRQVRSHNREWNAVGGDVTRLKRLPSQPAPTVAAKPRSKTSPAKSTGSRAQLKIVGQPADKAQAMKKATENAIAPWQQKVKSLEAELNLANEAAESRRLESQNLSSRLSRLEGTVNDMQRLISMKDNMIASLQDNLTRLREGTLHNAAPKAPTKPAAKPASTAPKPRQSVAQSAATPKPGQSAKPAAQKPKLDRKNFKVDYGNEPETSLLDDVFANPLLLIVGLLVLVLPGAYFLKKRKAGKEEDDDDVMAVELDKDDEDHDAPENDKAKSKPGFSKPGFSLAGLLKRKPKADAEDSESEEDEAETVKEAKADKKSKSLDWKKWFSFGKKNNQDADEDETGLDAATIAAGLAGTVAAAGATTALAGDAEHEQSDSGESDVLGEADQFLTYGRHDQALDLLNDALAQDPRNEALLLKRLEAHHLAGNTVEFESQAEAFYADRDGVDDAAWQKVMTWGRDLCPQNPLFSDNVPDTEMLANFSNALDDDIVELDDLGLDGDLNALDSPGLDSSELDLGADLGLGSASDKLGAESQDEAGVSADSGMGELNPDLNLGDMDLDTDQLGLGDSASTPAEDEGLVFDTGDAPVIDQEAMETIVDEDLVPGLEMEVATGDEGSAAIDPDELELLFGDAPATSEALVEDEPAFTADADKPAASKAVDEVSDLPDVASDSAITLDDSDSLELPEMDAPPMGSSSGSSSGGGEDEIEFDLSGFDFKEEEDQFADVDDSVVSEKPEEQELDDQFSTLESEIDMADNALEENALEENALEENALEENAEISAEPDEVDTKLDLARAYIDMGDPEGARVMLEEVLEEGNDKQQGDAKSLIGQIE